MKLSKFGEKFTRQAGILSLMDDLGRALASGNEDLIMMGGGNPGHIPEVQNIIRQRLQDLLADPDKLHHLVGVYGPPQGDWDFIAALAHLLQRECGWDIGPENIALTNGSQAAFFLLFNMFAGPCTDGSQRQIQLPLAPEYIGYTDAGLSDNFFTAARPDIEYIDAHTFKYRVNFDAIHITEQTGALCVSRPTNPTGNVLTDDEVNQLATLARQHDIPLILDNAYGMPFPGMVFTEATPLYDKNTIVCMSLSKLGLPAARTGIVIARPEIVRALAGINAIVNLTTGSFGSALALELVRSGEILRLSREVIAPFYRRRAEHAIAWAHEYLQGCDYYVHKAEGAMFLWLWFKDLPITNLELYERLKQRGVVVVSGHYFFPGIEEEWPHRHQCIRVTYAQDEDDVNRGMQIIGAEVKKAYEI